MQKDIIYDAFGQKKKKAPDAVLGSSVENAPLLEEKEYGEEVQVFFSPYLYSTFSSLTSNTRSLLSFIF